MATNPLPADAATAQGVYDSSITKFRVRGDDERTVPGEGIEHTKYIICPAIGVRLHSNPLLHKAVACTFHCPRQPGPCIYHICMGSRPDLPPLTLAPLCAGVTEEHGEGGQERERLEGHGLQVQSKHILVDIA